MEPFHAPTRISMKLAGSVSGIVKTRNQVLNHVIELPLPWQQHPKISTKKEAKMTWKMTFLPLKYYTNGFYQSQTWTYFEQTDLI